LKDTADPSSAALEIVERRAATLNLPNWYLAAGAVSQTIWNAVSSPPPETGIDDYDLVYYDSSNLSFEAEDKVIVTGWISREPSTMAKARVGAER
jgi:uncharacterized protein